MKLHKFIFGLLILLSLSCESNLSHEDFERKVFNQVFNEIVDSTYQQSIPKNNNLVIAVLEKGSVSNKITLTKYNTLNLRFMKVPHNIIPELDQNLKYKKYAGIMSFSNIIFNPDRSTGTMDVSLTCGGKCGFGFNVTIYKEKKSWKVQKVVKTWIW